MVLSCSNPYSKDNKTSKEKTFEECNGDFFMHSFDKVFISYIDSKLNDTLPLNETISKVKHARSNVVKFFPKKYIVFSRDSIKVDSLGYSGKYIKYKGRTFFMGDW